MRVHVASGVFRRDPRAALENLGLTSETLAIGIGERRRGESDSGVGDP
jgi:hypothetical protein